MIRRKHIVGNVLRKRFRLRTASNVVVTETDVSTRTRSIGRGTPTMYIYTPRGPAWV